MADDELRPAPEELSEPEELEIEFHGEPQPAEESSGELLEITQQDIADGSEEDLPAISGLDAAVAEGTANWVDIPVVCGQTGNGFVVCFQEVKPGRYVCVGAEQRSDLTGHQQVVGGGTIKGSFGLRDYPGCPVCGEPGLVVCSGCGTVSCGASVRQTKPGLIMTCPHCHQDGEVQPGGPGTRVWATGSAKKQRLLD